MRRALRAASAALLASTWLLVAGLAPVAGQDYGPGQPDPCVFVRPFDPDARLIANSLGVGICTAAMVLDSEPHGPRGISLDVYRRLTVEDALQFARGLADNRPATASYGGQAYEGSGARPNEFRIVFVVHNYVGVSASWDFDADRARANAQQLYTAMAAQIGPPQAGASPTASPSASPGTLTLGLGCGTDERFVRCTASTFGARTDADLVFVWLLDGQARPETGSTMQLDWLS